MSVFCHSCGQKLRDDARFCSKCGTAVSHALEEITAEYRQTVYDELGEVMLGGLDSGAVTVEDSKDIAAFVLARLDNISTKEELAGFVEELAQKWPVYENVRDTLYHEFPATGHDNGQTTAREKRPSLDSANQFIQEVQRVRDAAQMDGEVTDEIFQHAIALFERLEKSNDSAILNHPQISLARLTLRFYHDVWKARAYLKKRWEDDRIKRGRNKLFKRQMKLVVADYIVFGTSCNSSWDLVTYVRVPSIDASTTTSGFLLGWPHVLVYFDRILVEDIFCALLADGENPRSYTEAFAGLEARYGNRNIEHTLNRLTRKY